MAVGWENFKQNILKPLSAALIKKYIACQNNVKFPHDYLAQNPKRPIYWFQGCKWTLSTVNDFIEWNYN